MACPQYSWRKHHPASATYCAYEGVNGACSFWNFDALFQPQQHPARDAHDTFFLTSARSPRPAHAFALLSRMPQCEHSSGQRCRACGASRVLHLVAKLTQCSAMQSLPPRGWTGSRRTMCRGCGASMSAVASALLGEQRSLHTERPDGSSCAQYCYGVEACLCASHIYSM